MRGEAHKSDIVSIRLILRALQRDFTAFEGRWLQVRLEQEMLQEHGREEPGNCSEASSPMQIPKPASPLALPCGPTGSGHQAFFKNREGSCILGDTPTTDVSSALI